MTVAATGRATATAAAVLIAVAAAVTGIAGAADRSAPSAARPLAASAPSGTVLTAPPGFGEGFATGSSQSPADGPSLEVPAADTTPGTPTAAASPSATPPSVTPSPQGSSSASLASTNPTSASPTDSSGQSAVPVPAGPSTAIAPVEVPAVPPAAQRSGISLGTGLAALAVLLLALAVVLTVRRRPVPAPASGARPPVREPVGAADSTDDRSPPADGSSLDELMSLLVELGDTMVISGDPVTHVQAVLQRVALINGVRDAEVIVLPTALIITLPGLREARTEVATTGRSALRLDQIDAVFTTAGAAERGEIGVRAALGDLQRARGLAPTFGPAVIVAGHAVIAVGLSIILAGGWASLPVAAMLGAAVGIAKEWAADRRLAVQVFLPITCAFVVSAAVALLVRTDLDPGVLPPIIGALVTFIPGGLLTTAVIELATGQMISGASRFVFGTLQLVLLAFGIVAGVQLVGLPVIELAPAGSSPLGFFAPWIGVLVFGLGVLLSFSGRAASFGWMLLVLYVAYAGQLLGGLLVGSYLSGFVGAAVMTPVAVFAATQRSGPPTLVTFLPAFWLLVPGAVALIGVTQVMGDTRVDGVSTILTAGVTIVAIALGVVLGLSLGDQFSGPVKSPEPG